MIFILFYKHRSLLKSKKFEKGLRESLTQSQLHGKFRPRGLSAILAKYQDTQTKKTKNFVCLQFRLYIPNMHFGLYIPEMQFYLYIPNMLRGLWILRFSVAALIKLD